MNSEPLDESPKRVWLRSILAGFIATSSAVLWYVGSSAHGLERLWAHAPQSLRESLLATTSWLVLAAGALLGTLLLADSKQTRAATFLWSLATWAHLLALQGALDGALRGLVFAASVPLAALCWAVGRHQPSSAAAQD